MVVSVNVDCFWHFVISNGINLDLIDDTSGFLHAWPIINSLQISLDRVLKLGEKKLVALTYREHGRECHLNESI